MKRQGLRKKGVCIPCASLFVRNSTNNAQVQDIVVIGSTVGRQVSAFNPVYGATKFALHSLVEGLRQEICEHNIRVSLIEPGFVISEFQESAGYDMQWFRQLEQESDPFLTPEDVARAVNSIASQPAHVHIDDIRLRPTRQRV
jgi:NADP-dependent 3-hydroxy acid dehydrogenase YdfG